MKTQRPVPLCLTVLLAVLLAGCVHDYPTMTDDGEEGIDPTLVQVNTEVTLDLELLPLEVTTVMTSRTSATDGGIPADAPAAYRRRFIVEAWREGKPVARQVTLTEAGASGRFTLPVTLKLHAVEYTLAVWTDYVKAPAANAGAATDASASSATDLYYTTTDLQNITCTSPYTGGTPYRDCLCGTAPLDLRAYRDQWNARIGVPVNLSRPLAKYQLIATDVPEFLQKTLRQRQAGETYTLTVKYDFYMLLSYNVLTGVAGQSQLGIQFSAPLQVTDDGNGECTLVSDFFFVNAAESYAPLTLEIYDSQGRGISRTAGINVPYRRSHLTTVRWHFLTNRFDTGIGINPDFDPDDIEIDLDTWQPIDE